jgi:hypothetical protein
LGSKETKQSAKMKIKKTIISKVIDTVFTSRSFEVITLKNSPRRF